jgi:hypothetical protein
VTIDDNTAGFGVYTVKNQTTFTELLDPNTLDYCTKECVFELIEVVDTEMMSLFNFKDPTIQELKPQLSILGINYCVRLNGKWGNVIINSDSKPVLWLDVVPASRGLHCKLMRCNLPITTCTTLIPWKNEELPSSFNDAWAATLNVNSKTINEALTEMTVTLTVKIKDITAAKLNLYERLVRQPNKFILVNVSKISKNLDACDMYLTWDSDKFSNNCIYITNNTKNGEIEFFLVVKNQDASLLIFNSKVHILNKLSCYKISKDIFSDDLSLRSVIRHDKKDNIYFLNSVAKLKNRVKKYKHCQVWNNQTDAIIIFNYADNYKHHKYNYKQIGANVNNLILPKKFGRVRLCDIFLRKL